jgi:hypothetical protein
MTRTPLELETTSFLDTLPQSPPATFLWKKNKYVLRCTILVSLFAILVVIMTTNNYASSEDAKVDQEASSALTDIVKKIAQSKTFCEVRIAKHGYKELRWWVIGIFE